MKKDICTEEECIREAVKQNNGKIDIFETGYELVHEIDWLGKVIRIKFMAISVVGDSVWVEYDVHLPTCLVDASSLLRDLPEPVVIALADSVNKLNYICENEKKGIN